MIPCREMGDVEVFEEWLAMIENNRFIKRNLNRNSEPLQRMGSFN